MMSRARDGNFLGICQFPLVMKHDGSVRIGTIRVSSFQVPDDEGNAHYINLPEPQGRDPRLFFDVQLWRDAETRLAVTSAFCAVDDGHTVYYVDAFPDEIKISGASLGIATIIAMMGYRPGEKYAFTGYASAYGRGWNFDLLKVFPVDCETTKLTALNGNGISLVMSAYSAKIQEDCPGCVPIATMGEMVEFLERIDAAKAATPKMGSSSRSGRGPLLILQRAPFRSTGMRDEMRDEMRGGMAQMAQTSQTMTASGEFLDFLTQKRWEAADALIDAHPDVVKETINDDPDLAGSLSTALKYGAPQALVDKILALDPNQASFAAQETVPPRYQKATRRAEDVAKNAAFLQMQMMGGAVSRYISVPTEKEFDEMVKRGLHRRGGRFVKAVYADAPPPGYSAVRRDYHPLTTVGEYDGAAKGQFSRKRRRKI